MHSMNRRSFLGELAGAGAAALVPGSAHAEGTAALRGLAGAASPTETLFVPFDSSGVLGDSVEGRAYLERLISEAIVPPLGEVVIYTHGWLTDDDDLMIIYDTLRLGMMHTLAAVAAAGHPRIAPPSSTLLIMTHWPSRWREGGPIGIDDLATFHSMEMRANLIGRTGLAGLVRLVLARLHADPALASTRLTLVGHSFGGRVAASALSAFAVQSPDLFAAAQTRTPINLIMLQPAMPADALEPDGLSQAHPYAQLVNYRNLRILLTRSRLDTVLQRFYPGQEAVQSADVDYAIAASQRIPALGAVGPTRRTWQAFNGGAVAEISVGAALQYGDVLSQTDRRLVVADLTALHQSHYDEDLHRPTGQPVPFGRPSAATRAYVGYHNDIYTGQVYGLACGLAGAAVRAAATAE